MTKPDPKSSPGASAEGLASVEATLRAIVGEGEARRKLPPVHLWNPEHCGDIGMEIRADGSWWHAGTRFSRDKLVRLFSTILRKDDDGRTYLVTPYEKVIVHVEDAPFIATRMDVAKGEGRGQSLVFLTNVGDTIVAGPEAPLRVETDPETLEPAPYVRVRGRLEAKLSRPVFYELADLAAPNPDNGGATLGVWSGGAFFDIGPAGG